MAINWKSESATDQARRFWQGLKEACYQEGLSATAGMRCPYKTTSFAAMHWRRGQSDRTGGSHGIDTFGED